MEKNRRDEKENRKLDFTVLTEKESQAVVGGADPDPMAPKCTDGVGG